MNSECSDHRSNIAKLVLGDLLPEERRILEAHLAECFQCRSERESYENTIRQLSAFGEESIPRHFFVHSESHVPNPWRLFRMMSPAWQSALACAAMLMLVVGVAAISRLQIQSSPAGWAVSFGQAGTDPATLKREILEAVDRKNLEARSAWVREVRDEISSSFDSVNRQRDLEFANILARMDSRLAGRITTSQGEVREDSRKLVSDLYRVISQERAQDLETINLRLDSTDVNNAMKARQTNEILGTLLQVADLKLR